MQKQFRGRLYDSDKADTLGHFCCGAYGDTDGYEEFLCRTEDGHYFLYGKGGNTSPYPEETVRCLSAARAEAWMTEHT